MRKAQDGGSTNAHQSAVTPIHVVRWSIEQSYQNSQRWVTNGGIFKAGESQNASLKGWLSRREFPLLRLRSSLSMLLWYISPCSIPIRKWTAKSHVCMCCTHSSRRSWRRTFPQPGPLLLAVYAGESLNGSSFFRQMELLLWLSPFAL